MLLTPDDMLISCHEEKNAVWDDDGETTTCSICKSMHPDEFVCAIANNELVEGWIWKGPHPSHCILESGEFHLKHLWDMSDEWLMAASLLILEATGMLYYWEGEVPLYYVPHVGFSMGRRLNKMSLPLDSQFMKAACDRHERIYKKRFDL